MAVARENHEGHESDEWRIEPVTSKRSYSGGRERESQVAGAARNDSPTFQRKDSKTQRLRELGFLRLRVHIGNGISRPSASRHSISRCSGNRLSLPTICTSIRASSSSCIISRRLRLLR